MNCGTCKYWRSINTDDFSGDLDGNALTHAARESLVSKKKRGLCLQIPVSASDSCLGEIDFSVQSYEPISYKPDGFTIVNEPPKAYVSTFYFDPYDLTQSFVSSEDFGCVLYEPVD